MAVLAVLGSPEPARLGPGAPAERQLQAGERHTYSLERSARPRLVLVEQRGINVALDAPPGRSDHSGEREGWESLVVPSGPGEPWRVEVVALEPGVPPGSYEIRVEDLPEERVRAESLLAEMGRLRATGDGESRRRLVALGEEALPLWRPLGRALEEARTLFLLGTAHRFLGDVRQAAAAFEKALPLWDRAGAARSAAGRSQTLTALGLARLSLGEHGAALELFGQALEIQRGRGDRHGEAVTLPNVCLARHSRGEWRESIPCYEEALRLLREVKAPDSEAITLVNLAGVYDLLGEPRRAREQYEQALASVRALGERMGELQVLNNLAVLLAGMGEIGEARSLYDQALERARSLGDRSWQGRVLHNRGHSYLGVGEPERAAADLDQALGLRREVGDRRGEILTLGLLGSARAQLGEPEAARALYLRALYLATRAGDRFLEASSLNLLGGLQLDSGEAGTALETLGRAADHFRALGSRRGMATALQLLGEAHLRSGRTEESLAPLGQALELQRAMEDRAGQARTLLSLALAERRSGHLDPAWSRAEEALALVESIRAGMIAPDLRASFLSSRQRAFELAIDLRMELARRHPGRGHAEAALGLSERARARSLLDLLQEARADVRQGIDPELRAQERELSQRLEAKARRRLEQLAGPADPVRKEESGRELRELLEESGRLEAEIRRRNPRYAALSLPEPLDAAAIRGLLDPGTMLLEYSLGEERSFLWAVTAGDIESFELPGRARIEALAREVYEGLRTVSAGDPAAVEAEAASRRALGELLLAPVSAKLGDRRLAVVADGALLYVPFAALPLPGGSAPLIERHELVLAPSASVLSIQRAMQRREPGRDGIAILADPVFDRRDPRVRGVAAGGEPAPDTSRGPLALSRLPGSRREAEAIAALLPGRVRTAVDFQASRGMVLRGELADARIVHFATHGAIDARNPELSGLVLSLVDEQGRPQEGFLGLADIYNLDLRADLVVLSGCETALGREMRGEGLIGLTRGFQYAGASRVIASLWPVQDRPTQELMVRLYRSLLEGLPPAAALRQAQLSLRRERRWQDPFYWASFVLQGDWQ